MQLVITPAACPLEGSARPRGDTLRALTGMPGFTAKIVRFGVFEADLASGELRKNGARVRLQEQPFQLLVALLERAGEMVTRDDLRQRLWPSDTFVDFDHSLNTAVNKLREALGDTASNPRFVQTVARRGYRFIAPVSVAEIAGVGPDPAPASALKQAESFSPEPATAPIHPELEIPLPKRGLPRGLFGLIQLMYLIFYVVALARLGEVHRVAESFLPGWGATAIVTAVLITAGVGIPLRLFLLSAVGFDHRGLGEKFRRLFPGVLALDQLWAVAPFLSVEVIGFGAAFAVCAALLYLPFAERSLVRMAYSAGEE
jgi:DNA-binding winged helix-turn-helix (wHTH) protein